jgi:hypothetical protein
VAFKLTYDIRDPGPYYWSVTFNCGHERSGLAKTRLEGCLRPLWVLLTHRRAHHQRSGR